jgi:hypothetical protein
VITSGRFWIFIVLLRNVMQNVPMVAETIQWFIAWFWNFQYVQQSNAITNTSGAWCLYKNQYEFNYLTTVFKVFVDGTIVSVYFY